MEGTEAVGPLPPPLKFTVWMVPETKLVLSVNVKVAARLPGVWGEKVTETEQIEPTPSEVEQLLAWNWKSAAPDPPRTGPLRVMAMFPLLVSVTVWAAVV